MSFLFQKSLWEMGLRGGMGRMGLAIIKNKLIQSGRSKKGKTIVFFEVYELARIGTNYMIFKI